MSEFFTIYSILQKALDGTKIKLNYPKMTPENEETFHSLWDDGEDKVLDYVVHNPTNLRPKERKTILGYLSAMHSTQSSMDEPDILPAIQGMDEPDMLTAIQSVASGKQAESIMESFESMSTLAGVDVSKTLKEATPSQFSEAREMLSSTLGLSDGDPMAGILNDMIDNMGQNIQGLSGNKNIIEHLGKVMNDTIASRVESGDLTKEQIEASAKMLMSSLPKTLEKAISQKMMGGKPSESRESRREKLKKKWRQKYENGN